MNKTTANRIAKQLHETGHYGIVICQSYPSDGTWYVKSINVAGSTRIYNSQHDAEMEGF